MPYLFALVSLLVVMVFMPTSVQAATTSRTLQPGRVYAFTGRDARVISHVNVTGVGRYQYVAQNARDEVTSFGFSSGRFSINGAGTTFITPLAPLTVSFDSTRLAIVQRAGTALNQVQLAPGQTAAFDNLHRGSLHIRTNQAAYFQAVVLDASGNITFINPEVRFPQMNIPVGGTAMLTALEGTVLVYYPAAWSGSQLQSQRVAHPALFTYELVAGQIFALTNTSDRALAATAAPLFTTAPFAYEFIVRNLHGFATNHGDATGNSINVAARHSLTFTPLMDADLFFPYVWQQYLQFDDGDDTPAFYTLDVGQSLVIYNADPIRPYNIYLASYPAGYAVVFDFTIVTEDDVQFGIRSSAGTLSLPPGGTLTITAGEPPAWAAQQLAVRFPDTPEITLRAALPGIAQYVLQEGASLVITNTGEEDFPIVMRNTDPRADQETLDFIVWDADNEIAGFGRRAVGTTYMLQPGYRVHFTNTYENEVGLFFPLAWREMGLEVDDTITAPALVRRVLQDGEFARFDNVNRLYNMDLLIENENGTRPIAFEYFATDTRNVMLAYGESAAGTFTLRYHSRLVVAPVRGGSISVSFPAEWYGSVFRSVATANPPIHRITLVSGSRLTIFNQTSTDFVLANNSAGTAAGYFIRTGAAVFEPFGLAPGEQPRMGPIALPRNSNILIVAASGADLHIMMPWTVARQLRLV